MGKTEITNARVKTELNGDLVVFISVQSTTNVRVGKTTKEVSATDIIRCSRLHKKMDMKIVEAFWDEVNRVVDNEGY